MRILFVKLSSIGDVVHTLPALAAVRRALPAASVSWVVERSAAEILRGSESIDHLIEVDTRALRGGRAAARLREAGRQRRELRRFEFDVALDFQGLLKSAAIARLARARRVYGFARAALREPASRFLLSGSFAAPERIHVIRKNLALAGEALGIAVPAADFEFPIAAGDAHRAEAARIAAEAGGPFAIINPAGGWPTKLWPADRFGALADRLWEEHGLASVVTLGPHESALGAAVLAGSRAGRAFAAQPSLKGFYELAKRARVYVGGDTGPTHLAVAAGAPVVGIFGPTEWWRNGSPDPRDVCVERLDIGCRVDCHRRRCANWICLDIPVAAVAAAVTERLK